MDGNFFGSFANPLGNSIGSLFGAFEQTIEAGAVPLAQFLAIGVYQQQF